MKRSCALAAGLYLLRIPSPPVACGSLGDGGPEFSDSL